MTSETPDDGRSGRHTDTRPARGGRRRADTRPIPDGGAGTDADPGGETTPQFRFETSVPLRFRDLDAAGHVHNGVYAVYCEQGRLAYLMAVLGLDPTEMSADGAVVANLSVDYRRRITESLAVQVAVAVTDVGETSFRMCYEIRVRDDDAGEDGPGYVVAAEAETTMVAVDEDGPRPVPDEWRNAVRTYEPGLPDPEPEPGDDTDDGDGDE